MAPRSSSPLARFGLLGAATVLALVAAELAVRLLAPMPDLFPHWQWQAMPDGDEVDYVVDSDLGFRPVLGRGEYSEFGTVVNDYPVEKTEGVERVLFVGDSVTHRWRIQRVLLNRCRNRPVEFWNAGVEAFNTGQEVEYYLRFNHRIRPDHVTLVFHNNDFVATPVAFRNDNGELVVMNPHAYMSKTNVRLARWSHLYRHYLSARIARLRAEDPITTAEETQAAIKRLQDNLRTNGIGFDVILAPVFKPPNEWTTYERRSRELSLEIFEELEIPVYDLFETLEIAARKGLELTETPGDPWHPSDEFARRAARHLIRMGYLESLLGPGGCEPNQLEPNAADLQPTADPY